MQLQAWVVTNLMRKHPSLVMWDTHKPYDILTGQYAENRIYNNTCCLIINDHKSSSSNSSRVSIHYSNTQSSCQSCIHRIPILIL